MKLSLGRLYVILSTYKVDYAPSYGISLAFGSGKFDYLSTGIQIDFGKRFFIFHLGIKKLGYKI